MIPKAGDTVAIDPWYEDRMMEEHPEDFAARAARLFTAEQVSDMFTQVVELLRGDVPEENCRRALGKLDEWLLEFKIADAPVVVGGVAPDTGGGRQETEARSQNQATAC